MARWWLLGSTLGMVLGGMLLLAGCSPDATHVGEGDTATGPGAGCPELRTIDGDVLITSDDDLSALACIERIRGSLAIYSVKVTSLVGLETLRVVEGNLSIDETLFLDSLAGLDGVREVHGELRMRGNVLRSISALSGLSEVGGELEIDDNSLHSLTGLENLASIGDRVSVTNNVFLESIDALEGLTRIGGDLIIAWNEKLESVGLLGGLETVTGRVEVKENPGMTSFTIPASTSVGELFVCSNVSLAEIRAPSGFVRVDGDVTIIQNEVLSNTDAEALAGSLEVTGAVKVDGNLGAPEHIDGCPWADDGTCDEPEQPCGPGPCHECCCERLGPRGLCPEGTDTNDC
jgi:hypothetical protein